MADAGHLALIHAEIDGELDVAGRAQLAQWLLAHPEDHALCADLKRLCAALDSFDAVEPPEGFKGSILAALPARSARPQRRSVPAWRIAALVAGVVVAGAAVLEVVKGPLPPASQVVGTMSAPPVTTLDTVQLPNGPLAGQVSLYRDLAGLGLKLELRGALPVDLQINAGGRALRVSGLGAKDQPQPVTVVLAGVPADAERVDLVFFLPGGRQVAAATLRSPAKR